MSKFSFWHGALAIAALVAGLTLTGTPAQAGFMDITVILDKSGSMESVRSDTIGGFNAFLKDQQKVKGEARITLIQFDTRHQVVYAGRPIQEAEPLTLATYQPSGMTALLDAANRAIGEAETRNYLSRPEKVVIVLITDGLENSSRETTKVQLKAKIEQKIKEGWQFVYLGANQDAFAEAGHMGMAPGAAADYNATQQGTRKAFESVSDKLSKFRSGENKGMEWTDKERKDLKSTK